MNNFCVCFNTANIANLSYFDISLKKNYLLLLYNLKKNNCILNYTILYKNITGKNMIRVFLRYYKNRPICYLKVVSKPGNKKYYSNFVLEKTRKHCSNFIFSTDLGFLSFDELRYKKIGGLALLKIEFLGRNINC